jgi:hypothetical protein
MVVDLLLVLFYGVPNEYIPSGFGVLNSTGAIQSVTAMDSAMELKGIVDTMGMTYLDDGYIIVYGNIQKLDSKKKSQDHLTKTRRSYRRSNASVHETIEEL